jgi:hypothetical protein
MKAPALELGDIFRLHGPAYLTTFGDSLSHEKKKALRAIAVCRTAALGGHVDQCDQCGYRKISYCSCRNRHCPKCHGQARARWLEQRAIELLPVEYFHVVFTLPQLVAPLALQNQQLIYGISSVPRPKPCYKSRLIRGTSAPGSAFWQFCIPGDKIFIIIHISIASFPEAGLPATSAAGFRVGGSSCFRSRCSAVSSGADSSHI